MEVIYRTDYLLNQFGSCQLFKRRDSTLFESVYTHVYYLAQCLGPTECSFMFSIREEGRLKWRLLLGPSESKKEGDPE